MVQQSSNPPGYGSLKLGESDDKYEQQADRVAEGALRLNNTENQVNSGVIQRFSLAGVKTKLGGIFNRGGNTGSNRSSPSSQSTSSQAQTTLPPKPSTPPPVPTIPAGLLADEWELIQQAGVKDKADWRSLGPDKQRVIFDTIKNEFTIAEQLVKANQNNNWPEDENGAKIFNLSRIKLIVNSFNMTFDKWSSIESSKKKALLTLSIKPFIGLLAELAKNDQWPKDGSDADITDETTFDTITKTWRISLLQWNMISDKDQRDFLLKNSTKPYTDELVRAAMKNLWPKDGSSNPIMDDGKFTKITDGIGINLWTWINVNSANQREFLLKAGSLSKDQLKELALSAKAGVWPKDGNDSDINSQDEWKKIKTAFPAMSPSYWNNFDKTVRGNAVSASDSTGAQKIINAANFQSKSKKGALDTIGDVSGHALVDATTGTVGLTSSIIGASKGINDNTTLDRWSGGVGAIGDTASVVASGGSLLGGIAKYRRGKKLANDPNATRAAKEVGKKEKSKGSWGITQSAFGMAGSTASLGGNLTKAIDPETDEGKATSSGFGVASGFLGMFGSALGIGKSSASINSARKRSNKARGFIKKAGTGTTLSAEEEKLNKVAAFTAKNQNKAGKGMGIFKGVTSFLASSLNTIGSIGSLSGMSNEAGFGLGVTSAVLSGFGILGGLGQWAAESTGKPKDTDLEAQANSLIELLRLGDPKGKEAAKFVKDVLKINLLDLTDPTSWSSWIDEDEAAAKELIKSKLSKF